LPHDHREWLWGLICQQAKWQAALAAMTLSGCIPAVMHWAKAGATQDAFMQDRYVCLQQASKANRADT
jgi:hypothetical protein